MPVTWSPDLLLPGQKIPRAVVSIPRDQQILHDRSDAWTRRGVPNVPPSVLEGVKNFHTRNQTTVPVQSDHLSHPQSTRQDKQAAHPPSDDGTVITWPSSPVRMRDQGTPAPLPASSPTSSPAPRPAPAGTPREVPTKEASIPSQTLANNPATVKPTPRRHARVDRILAEPPLSSLASSDSGLEVEPPRAIPAALEPVNREAAAIAVEPTPPSAQIIPCTYTEHPSPPKPPPAKRKRLMKDPNEIFTTPEPVGRSRNSMTAPPTTASYLSRQTSRPRSSNGPVSVSAPAQLSHSAGDDVRLVRAVTRGVQTIHDSQEATNGHHSSSSEQIIPPNGPASQVPYMAFKLAYPDFKADLHDFIRGLLTVKMYRKKILLPRFLYDDFIRVFCGDYLTYTDDMDATGENNLSAVKWYNLNVTMPRYMKGIVTSDNINDILGQYPEVVTYLEAQAGDGKITSTNASIATPIRAEIPVPGPPRSLPKSPPAIGAERETVSPRHEPVPDPMDIASPPGEASVEVDKVISPAASERSARSSTLRPGAFHTRPFKVEDPVASTQEPDLDTTARPEPRRPLRNFLSRRLPGSLPEQRAPQSAESPVIAYAKRHSFRTDPLPTTSVPLSQQSNTGSITDPPVRKKRKKVKISWDDYLKMQPPSSSIAGPSA